MAKACGSTFNVGTVTLSDGSIKYLYFDGSFEICGVEGEYYNEDSAGNWNWQGVDGSKCSGSVSGGWYCSMADGSQYSGGDWTQAPAARAKQRAAASKGTGATTPATTTTSPATTPGPGGPPASIAPADDVKTEEYHDQYGSLVQKFASGASYYQFTDGTWTYQDGQGNQWDGDAAGNYCDSWGNCTGAWAQTPQTPPSSGWMPLVLVGGAAVFLLLLAEGGGGRRRR